MNITVNLSNSNRIIYYNNISSSLTLTYPFNCSGTNLTVTTWPSNTNTLTINLIDC